MRRRRLPGRELACNWPSSRRIGTPQHSPARQAAYEGAQQVAEQEPCPPNKHPLSVLSPLSHTTNPLKRPRNHHRNHPVARYDPFDPPSAPARRSKPRGSPISVTRVSVAADKAPQQALPEATEAPSAMTSRPQLKTEQLDMDSFFDFSGTNGASPTTASTSRADVMSPFDKEEQQQFNGPSHDYGQFKQQVGLPVGSLANMPQPGMFDGFTDFNSGFGWNSGLDMDSEMTMDFNSQQSMFYPTDSPSANFVDPNSIGGQEPASNVGRLWPGMHSQQAQQAAMQKAAQAQALQQRQMKLQAQQAQYRQAANPAQPSQGSSQHGKRASHVTEPHVEESISRLLNPMRQNNNAGSSEDGASPSDVLPHIARMKKDEEEMDEDERLLASDEGKKLSSKERRQLRNKVSARAFRSRRKGKTCRHPRIGHQLTLSQNTLVNSKAKLP